MREVFSVAAVIALLWPSAGVAENFQSAGDSIVRPVVAASKPAPAAVGTTATTAGAYRSLSAGNQQIAEALFNSQSVGAGTRQAWSLDYIASMKQGGAGWGQIFQRMHAEGVIPETSLGSVLSQSRRPAAPAVPKRATVIVTGAGKVYFAGGSGRSAAPADRAPQPRRGDVADERPAPEKAVAQRPHGGRGWIAASGGRSGTPVYGVATASSQGIHGGSVGMARTGRARN